MDQIIELLDVTTRAVFLVYMIVVGSLLYRSLRDGY